MEWWEMGQVNVWILCNTPRKWKKDNEKADFKMIAHKVFGEADGLLIIFFARGES